MENRTMGTIEQDKIKAEYYKEAIRYMDNAKETLMKAGKEVKMPKRM